MGCSSSIPKVHSNATDNGWFTDPVGRELAKIRGGAATATVSEPTIHKNVDMCLSLCYYKNSISVD